MTRFIIKKLSELNSENSGFLIQGFRGSAAANTTSNIDFQLPEERWFSGGIFYVYGGAWDDAASLQLIVINNGQEIIVDEFAKDICIDSSRSFQFQLDISYVHLIPSGAYLRIKYTNTHLTVARKVGMNAFTHIPTDAGA